MKPTLRILFLTGLLFLGCMAVAQEPSFSALQAQYDALESKLQACTDLPCMNRYETLIAPVERELTALDQEQIEADTALMVPLIAEVKHGVIILQTEAQRKWCHTSLWRWMRHYREPQWCEQNK